jgi:hypothetical protein
MDDQSTAKRCRNEKKAKVTSVPSFNATQSIIISLVQNQTSTLTPIIPHKQLFYIYKAAATAKTAPSASATDPVRDDALLAD